MKSGVSKEGIRYAVRQSGRSVAYCALTIGSGTRYEGRYGHFDFTDVMACEPEDLDIWEGQLYCPCNTDTAGCVYSLPYRDFVRAMMRK